MCLGREESVTLEEGIQGRCWMLCLMPRCQELAARRWLIHLERSLLDGAGTLGCPEHVPRGVGTWPDCVGRSAQTQTGCGPWGSCF